MSNMIRPTRPGTVRIPDNQMGGQPMGMGMGTQGIPGVQQNNPMQQQVSAADQIRVMLSQGLGSQSASGGTGFNWSSGGNGMYEDDVIRSLRGENTESGDSLTYYIERVAPGMAEYMKQIFHRMSGALLFEEFRKSRENFRLNPITSQVDEVCNAFIDDVNKHHEFTKIIALHGAPYFGKDLIDSLRKNNKESLTQADYLGAVNIAVRNVLYFELISWLTKSPRGKMYALRLPKHLEVAIGNLPKIKEHADKVFEIFGQTSPYGALEFKRPESTRPDFAMLYGNMMGYQDTLFDSYGQPAYQQPRQATAGDYGNMTKAEYEETMRVIYRNAAERARSQGQQFATPQQQTTVDGATTNWNGVRSDWQNLTPENRDQFATRTYFNMIKPGYYVIPETDWKNVKAGYKRHPEMKQEETVLPQCFRVVKIDLENDTGWVSMVVRAKELDLVMVLTNPKRLLPYLESPDEMNRVNVTPVKLSEVGDAEKLHIEVAVCRELEKEIPLVTIEDPVVSQASAEVETLINTANKRVSGNFKDVNATGFKATHWDTFTCASKEDKVRLFQDLPFLFKDSESDERKSFFQACREVAGYVRDGIVDKELTDFIASRLTTIVNDWLVNAMGYDLDPSGENHLSVDNILEDFRDLSEHLKETDPVAYHDLHETSPNRYLQSTIQIFTYKNKKEDENLTAVERLQQELDLVVERPLCVTVINHTGGPIHTPGEVVYIKRSQFPEYFQLMENGFDKIMGDEANPDVIDKVMMFSDSNNMWLFTQSAIDANVATLRHITRKDPLVLMPLD